MVAIENKKVNNNEEIEPLTDYIVTSLGGVRWIVSKEMDGDLSRTMRDFILDLFSASLQRLDFREILYSKEIILEGNTSAGKRVIYVHIPFEYKNKLLNIIFQLQGIRETGRPSLLLHAVILDSKDYKMVGCNPLSCQDRFVRYEELYMRAETSGVKKAFGEIEEELRRKGIRVKRDLEIEENFTVKDVYYRNDGRRVEFVIPYNGDLESLIYYLYKGVLGNVLCYMKLQNYLYNVGNTWNFLTIKLIDEETERDNKSYFEYLKKTNLNNLKRFAQIFVNKIGSQI